MFYSRKTKKSCIFFKKNYKLWSAKSVCLSLILFLIATFRVCLAQPYRNAQRCSHRLESALEQVRRRSVQSKSSRSYTSQTPYSLYHSIYGQKDDLEEDFYHPINVNRRHYARSINNIFKPNSRLDFEAALMQAQNVHQNQKRKPNRLPVARAEVEDLKVKLAKDNSARWVEIDKCKFNSENSTLDTRLIFPDLTLSGKVVLQPTGGKCNMILRLRRAGIEFRTIPIGFEKITGEVSKRIGAASVRTDSHFSEPGFISVFAHGCQGPTGIKLRQNSKRRHDFEEQQSDHLAQGPLAPEVLFDMRNEGYIPPNVRERELDWTGTDSQEYFEANADNFYQKQFRFKRSTPFHHSRQTFSLDHLTDEMIFDDDILLLSDDMLQDLVQPDARAFADIFSANTGTDGDMFQNEEEINDAMRSELENLFSMGMRGLLTTYMQKSLQPAIKETLMENMGYTISYG